MLNSESRLNTDGSWADWICSTKPISRTSGRAAIHSLLSCSSAWVRIWLSGDERPWSRLARAAWTSGGRTDILKDGEKKQRLQILGGTMV